MGILERIAIRTAINIAAKTGVMDKVSNKIGSTLNKITKTKEVDEILANTSFKYKIALEHEKRGSCEWLYTVFDENRNEKYRIEKGTLRSNIIRLLDNNNKVIGYVKRKKMVFSNPLEHDLQECEIVLNNRYLCEVRAYYSLSGGELETDYDNMELTTNVCHTFFEVFLNDTLVCQIYKPFAEAKNKETYILLYNNKRYERKFLMLALTMENIYFND